MPTPSIIVLHCQGQHYAKPEEASNREEPHKFWAVFDVHEEQYHQCGFDQRDNQGDRCIEKSHINEGDCDGDADGLVLGRVLGPAVGLASLP